MHSGRVGGGTPGVGKLEFLTWSDADVIDVIDSVGRVRGGQFVMQVSTLGATETAKNYVQKVSEFKKAVRAGELDTAQFKGRLQEFKDYFSESQGRRRGRRSATIDYVTRHGEIVDALHDWRKAMRLAPNARIVKSRLIDLGIANETQLLELYEVKTSADRSDLYGAIGQLVVHGQCKGCRRFIVLPDSEKLPRDISLALKNAAIDEVHFSWKAGWQFKVNDTTKI